MQPSNSRLKALVSWANHGWIAIWLQFSGAVLLVFGILCVLEMRPGIFAYGEGVILAFTQFLIPDADLPAVGWSCIGLAVFLALLTITAQRTQLARFKRDQTMLQRQDWRKK